MAEVFKKAATSLTLIFDGHKRILARKLAAWEEVEHCELAEDRV
ncbi:hypothetical protein [Streptococcus himalayensis]|nr:hypothetical protein [Streptococcus himalayensis]